MKILEIKNINKSYNFIEKNIKPIILEYYDDIFENENKSDNYYQKIKGEYCKFIKDNLLSEENENIKEIRKIMKIDKTDELNELIKSSYIKEFLKILKKIFLFVEFHEPQLNLKLDKISVRKPIIKQMKQIDCILADGYIKDLKNCLILIDPPLLKNGYPYSGLKPIAIIVPDNANCNEIINSENRSEKNKKNLNISLSNHNNNLSENNNDINNNLNKSSKNNFFDNKDISIPLQKDDRPNNKLKISDLEKKEKTLQFILDNDKEIDLSNSPYGLTGLNKNNVNCEKDNIKENSKYKKNYIDEEIYGKYHDVAFSKNPITSSSKDLSNSERKYEKEKSNLTEKIDNKNIIVDMKE